MTGARGIVGRRVVPRTKAARRRRRVVLRRAFSMLTAPNSLLRSIVDYHDIVTSLL